MRDIHGEQYAQVERADPFAPAVWRSPVHRTPEWIIWLVHLLRLLWRVAWFVVRHPLLDVAAGVLVLAWYQAGWPGVIAAVTSALGVLGIVRIMWPDWFTKLVTVPARSRWRWLWCYRRRWRAVMTVAGLGPKYRGHVTLPALGKAQAGRCADLVAVRLVSGQSPKLFADRAEELAHGFGAHSCRVRTARPGSVVLEFVRRDALAAVIPALPIPGEPDLRALPVGRCEDGKAFTIRLHGTHLLIAGSTGAGKGSYLWGLVRALLPAMAAGLVRVHACDPKLMELAFGREARRDPGRTRPRPSGRAGHGRPGRGDHRVRCARQGHARQTRTPSPVHPAPPRRPRPAQASDGSHHSRQDLHRTGRHHVPAIDVPDPHLL